MPQKHAAERACAASIMQLRALLEARIACMRAHDHSCGQRGSDGFLVPGRFTGATFVRKPCTLQPSEEDPLSRSKIARAFALSLFVVPASFGCAPTTAVVQSALPQGISVNGHGEAQGQPDIARVTLGVETRSKVASEATDLANQQMAAVIAAIKQQGVADKDIRTQNFSVNFEQQPDPYPPAPMEAPPSKEATRGAVTAAAPASELPRGFYRVSNTVQVSIRELAKLGAILGAATASGANSVWGIQFDIEDPSKLEADARQKAVAQARARAEQLAQLAGVKLGKVISVGESGGGVMQREAGFGYSMKAANASVPVQSGELTVSQDVQIVYATE
jgi:uncharacterized protein YggE